jgi:hypothetical protein
VTGLVTPLPVLNGYPVYTINRWQYPSPCRPGVGACRLRVWDAPGTGILAVVREQDDNPGPSVTRAAEQIISALGALYPGRPVVVFEHYPAAPSSTLESAREDRIAWVRLDGSRPVWAPVWPISERLPEFILHRAWWETCGQQIAAAKDANL